MLVAGAALLPAPALAAVANDPNASLCPNPDSPQSWFEKAACSALSEDGGGDGDPSADIRGIETINVGPRKCGQDGVVCVSTGVDGRSPRSIDSDRKPQKDGPDRGGSDQGRPSCKRPSTGRERDVCPHMVKNKKKPLSETLAEEMKRARACRAFEQSLDFIEEKMRTLEATGILNGRPRRGAELDEAREFLRSFYDDVIHDLHEKGCRLIPAT
jgi:hypothetical protein